jgi:anti-sigma factor RsiW
MMKPLNDHLHAQELFSAYIDNRTSADEKKFIERHLTSCDQDCRAVLAQTRSMISATKSLALVKAPRSFVLPKSMARKQARSIFDWYPALRLATSIAVIALVVVFASDVFTPRATSLSTNIPTSAGAPVSIAAAPTQAAVNVAPPVAPAAPTVAQAPMPQSAARILMTPTTTATDAAGAMTFAQPMTATDEALTPTAKLATDTLTSTEMAVAQVVDTPAAPETIAPVPASGGLAVQQPDQQLQPIGPTANPLRAIEFMLIALVIVLIAATLIARQRARSR